MIIVMLTDSFNEVEYVDGKKRRKDDDGPTYIYLHMDGAAKTR